MNLTNYLENKLTSHVLRNVAYTSPSSVFVALHTVNPTKTGSVGEVTTASFPSYTRKQLALGAPANGIGVSTADLTWNVDGNLTFTHVSIWDAANGGNPLFFGELSASKTMASGDIFRIPTGSLTAGFN